MQKFNNLLGLLITVFIFTCSTTTTYAQKQKNKENKEKKSVSSPFSSLQFRSIGPAFTSGRIADLAVNPDNPSEYYVAVASGHLWKTENNGTTWKPIFDKFGAYSMGCITIDPSNHNTIWLGTGENNHQRALGYGNGIWKSNNGGKTWQNKGLKSSRQIGKIVVDPTNSDIVYVAAEGSVWGPGGERGLYKTINGGTSWERVLEISENTGINDIVMDPRDPNTLYATSEQRRRRSFSKIGGGPESAVYKTTDGGKNWKKIMNGLFAGNIGGMGLAISPVNPDVLYLIMEASGKSGGFYRTTNRGASWKKMSSHHSSGQYYNEIFCDPKDVDKVYSVETYSHVTEDGGKTWKAISNNNRHVDDHALWIDPNDTKHIMIGGDGGLYESFDSGKNYLFKCNLPVTQFYRVAVDDTEPFYWVFGGTQDNNSLGGPSRNTSRAGVSSSEWITTVGGDGFWQAIEPGNSNIIYSESQYGHISRYDKKSKQSLSVKPQPRNDEETYRWNWNSPFIISPHKATRIYMAANKVFRSDDRGDTWDVISDDITRNMDRNSLKVMGKYWPSDAVKKDVSTSQWGTAVAICESPIQEGLLYVGTDDGLIQVTENNGKTWSEISSFPDVPKYAMVSDILASKVDTNVVFASFDDIKSDDFKPYLLKSEDKGKTWHSISANLPENGTVLCIEQDQDDKDLLFIGTEFNVFASLNGGKEWVKMNIGIPDVKICDITIQNREKDLVVATFGRGFYILDDYSPMIGANKEKIKKQADIFPIKDALLYVESGKLYGQGSTPYYAKNPKFGAQFTIYLDTVPETLKAIRKKLESKLFEEGKQIPQPTPEQLNTEKEEVAPIIILTIRDSRGEIVRQIFKTPSKGIRRINWNLRHMSLNPVEKKSDKFNPLQNGRSGMFALPGNYTVSLDMEFHEKRTQLVAPIPFKVELLDNSTLPINDTLALFAYQENVAELGRAMRGAQRLTNRLELEVASMRQVLHSFPEATPELKKETKKIAAELNKIQFTFYGSSAVASWEEIPPAQVPLNHRLSNISWSHYNSTSSPTSTNKSEYEIVKAKFSKILNQISDINIRVKIIQNKMAEMKTPWTPGQVPKY